MNARSLRAPSPLTSPPTIGVKRAPELARTMAEISNPGLSGHMIVPVIEWRRSWSLRPQSDTRGSPATDEPPNPCPPPNRSSRDRVYVYDVLSMISRRVKKPLTPSVSWRVSDRSLEVSLLTKPKRESTRDAASGTAPVAVSIADAGTNTGRLPSPARVKLGADTRLRSVDPVWLTPRAKDA